MISRRLANISKVSCRFLADSSSKSNSNKGKQLSRDDVEYLQNPSEEYVDAFMKWHGNSRTVFKKDDIAQLQDSFPDYKFKMFSLTGTTRPIITMHTCKHHPLNESKKPFVFIGLGWIDPEFRSRATAKFFDSLATEELKTKDDELMAWGNQEVRRFWHKLIGKKEHDDIGHQAMEVGYKSFYSGKDVTVPEKLDANGITVKNAREVPKKDIINYDQSIYPYHREKYIISHMHDKDGFGKVAYDEDGKVVGIGQAIFYDNKKDCKVGPIYAEDPKVAQAMFTEILKEMKCSGKEVSTFEMRSSQLCTHALHWFAPFLKEKPSRIHICNLTYKHCAPEDVDFSKIYVPARAQMFIA
ncbi:DUF1248 domain-containing protein [Caenorhabditis elegans]|uniref:DUF1248 domain-containing protein n=1 Tax=Caenorhabditis elegans TaxID=6239 RepID=Q22958_CAEEL|nr:DUF1248 domain-containing protein [Caenorhabditis elegans]CCD62815.2 DUF1248 domain-containing protein [Caenorhabditis elegans]|eukprot:NP_504868.2 Uncharacterized protein CELE_F10G2.7 [Caenorhabditis elegans]